MQSPSRLLAVHLVEPAHAGANPAPLWRAGDLAVDPPSAVRRALVSLATFAAACRARPEPAVILLMPVMGFAFAGLFLGEAVGLVLGIYFAGLNIILARGRLFGGAAAASVTTSMPLLTQEVSR